MRAWTYKGEKVPNRIGPSSKSLNCVASNAWMFLGSQVKNSQFLTICVWNVKTGLPSCLDTISVRFLTKSGNFPALFDCISRTILMIPSGSGLGRVGAGLQSYFLAAVACWYLVMIDETVLYRTNATKGHKSSRMTAYIVLKWARWVGSSTWVCGKKREERKGKGRSWCLNLANSFKLKSS